MKKNFIFKRVLTLVLAVMMLVTAMPVGVFAEPVGAGTQGDKFEIIYDDKSVVRKEDYINKTKDDGLPIKPYKLGEGEEAAKIVKDPRQPNIYTIRADFKVKRGNDYVINYQPYIVSVGESIPKPDQDKIKKDIDLPEIDGYTSPTKKFHVDYGFIQKEVKDGFKYGNKGEKTEIHGYGDVYKLNWPFKYEPKKSEIKVVHVFQHLYDKDKYGVSEDDAKLSKSERKKLGIKDDIIRSQSGYTGDIININHVEKSEMLGYEPEVNELKTQIPESTENFVIYVRYNRKHYSVKYDSKEGTEIPNRTLYYEQIIPKLAVGEIPTKLGSDFLGWKPSVDLETTDGITLKANEIIKDSKGNAIVDLYNTIYEKDKNGNLIYEDLKDPQTGKTIIDPLTGKPKKSIRAKTKTSSDTIEIKMPAGDLTFTAEWKDKEKTDYAVQFWAEKADHADGASLSEKYEYMGTHVYKDQPVKVKNKEGKWVGNSPDLDKEPVNGIVFPDLDQARLAKIWNGDKFYGDKYLYLDKFFVYNKDLTHKENADPKNPSIIKSISSTGQTVYNIYYDRQVYDLYFTKSNALSDENTFYPEIYVPDGDGGAKLAGGPGNPYHYQARFNQLMLGWPNDAMQTKGFDPGKQSYGWGPNYGYPQWPLHLDTPPYRLNADEFLDMPNYDNWGGYVAQIDKGDGTTIDVKKDPRYKDEPYKALSFGIKQEGGSMPHHMDFWMDGFKKGETIIRYDLYRSKADTNSLTYGHKYSRVQGFTPYGYTEGGNWPSVVEANEENGRVDEDGIDALNEERGKITPYPGKECTDTFGFNNALGQMHFRPAFFNNADPFGDPDGWSGFDKNGYIRFKYKRNKYPLRFNYNPLDIKDDSEFGSTNQLQTFYEFPLKVLSPDLVDKSTPQADREYFKDNPKNFLDNPDNLQTLGLTDLVETSGGKLRVKRPEGLAEQMEFKGWALDPAGTKLIWANEKERMPSHAVNLYAKWGPPDTKWTVTLDPNGGELGNVTPEMLTTEKKTIAEGDINDQKINTYPKKEANAGDKQKFTVIHLQKLKKLPEPKKDGFDFMGWEFVRYVKDKDGKDTSIVDDSYFKTYKVQELYTFGNEVVSNVHLRAIWIKNEIVDVELYHHFLDKDYKEKEGSPEHQTLKGARSGSYLGTVASRQDEKWLLAPDTELAGKGITAYDDYINLTKEYKAPKSPRTNTYNQFMIVTPEEVDANGHRTKSKENEFHFFYRPFRQREYTVKYIDERAIEKLNKAKTDEEKEAIIEKCAIIPDEKIVNGNRHTDARNYRPIPGWKLVSAPQQQLFFDVDEKTNEFLGINDTGKKYITFIYKDVRVIETTEDAPVPDGYVRVTFKADKGGVFKDKDGKEVNELYYDVIKGLRSDLLPVPQEWVKGEKNPDGSDKQKEDGKFYITPDKGKNFIKWDSKPLLNASTVIEKDDKDYYTFTAKFDWSDISVKGLVRTEAYKDQGASSGTNWSNNFAPTLEELKKQIIYKEEDKVKPLPEGTKVSFESEVNTSGPNEEIKPITDDEARKAIYEKVKEHNTADTDELVRTEKIKTLIKFKDGKNVNVLEIPVKIYKNRYEALTTGDKPLFLREAEEKTAEEGGLKEILANTNAKAYVKVTVAPTGVLTSKDNKVYYVNPKAWVNIPELSIPNEEIKEKGLTSWTADKAKQNEGSKEDGVFDFTKRHMFTEDTVIKPVFTEYVIPQTGTEKPADTPDTYVEVKFVPTENGTMNGTKIFWVNPEFEVTIPVADPIGKTYYTFKEWRIGVKADGDVYKPNEAKKFTGATTITATYNKAENVIEYDPSVPDPMVRPDGYIRISFVAENGIKLTGEKAYYVKKDAKDDRGNPMTLAHDSLDKPTYEVETGYKFDKWDPADTTVIKETDIVVTAKAISIPDVIKKSATNNKAPDGYKTVTFMALEHGHLEENNKTIEEKIYFVNPNKFVTINPPKTKADTGYKFGSWSMDATNYNQYKDDTTINASFNLEKAVVPKTKNDDKEKPEGFKTVNFVIKGEGGEIVDGETTTYFVDPKSDVSIDPPAIKAKTGYKFVRWSKDTTKPGKYTDDLTTVTGTFTKLDDIIPEKTNGVKNSQPEGYVKVTFDKGEHAKSIDGQVIYFVNPNADPKKTLGDESIVKPTVKAETGYKFTGWDEENTKIIEDSLYVIAQYSPIDDVIKAIDGGKKVDKPEGYITVTFDKGEHGTLEGNTVVYINPNKAVELEKFAPTVTPETGFSFADWDRAIKEKVQYENGNTITAQYNSKANIKIEEDSTYVKVIFKDGGKGTLDGTTEYWVNPDTDVNIPAPNVNANTGYRFDSWDKSLSVKLTKAQEPYEITAKYKKLDDIVPGDQSKPSGYLTVTFLKGDNGAKLEGQSVYYVNPTAGKTLADITKPKATADIGYKQKTGDQAWDTPDSTKITGKDITVTAKYDKIKNIVPGDQSKPEGYVTVIFRADTNGKLEGNVDEIKYYVNPKAGVKLVELREGQTQGENEIAVPKTIANANNVFDAWYENIDTKNTITSNKEYIARFTTSQVTLNYKVGLGSGDVPASVQVPYNTTIRLASSIGLSKENYYFDGWLIDGKKYKVGEEFTLTKNTEAVAQWDRGPYVIPYNSENPKARPDDSYIRVSFKSDEGIELEKLNSYYVKKGAGLFLSNTNIVAPTIIAKTGYESLGWDNTLRGPIGEDDIVITAKSKALDNVIPSKDSNGDPVIKPEGYKIVKFVAGANGEIREKNDTISEKTYYVNSEKYVTLTPPTTHGLVGYKFASWDKDATIPTVYKKDVTTIRASFVEEDAVSTEPKDGYKTVTFVIDSANGGKIAKEETTVYYVDPNREVTINPPQTKAEVGHVFEKWDNDTTVKQKYKVDTTVIGSFKPIEAVIPSTDASGEPNAKPDGYVEVTFLKGENGKLDGQTVYYVNPKADPAKTLAEITKPEVKAEVGYKFTGWDTKDDFKIKDNKTVIAQYETIDDVIPKDNPQGGENEKPAGYIKVTFSTETDGKITGIDKTEKVVYVNKLKAVTLKDKAPTVDPNTGYTFAGWDTQISKHILYSDGDVIKALYNEKDDISTSQKQGYVKVTFDGGANGTLPEQTVYYVNPNKEVTIPAPTVTPKIGWKQNDGDQAWDSKLTRTFTDETTITAQYTKLDNIIPGDQAKPDGYVEVNFASKFGTLSGTKTYYVNPNEEVDLTSEANGLAKEPNVGYKAEGSWNELLKGMFSSKKTFTFTFTAEENVIKIDRGSIERPKGYVKVTFIPTDKAIVQDKTSFYVNPNINVTLPAVAKPEGRVITDRDMNVTKYDFVKWTVTRGVVANWDSSDVIKSTFTQDTDITAIYTETVKPSNEPRAKTGVVKTVGDIAPDAKDLIANKFEDVVDKNIKLPEGTTFKYLNDIAPTLDKEGTVTAQVEVTYPGGKTEVVKVPITVVDNVVEQYGKDKPLVPETYVEVIVDTTDKATENTYYVKTFWVKPEEMVTIPALKPTGKEITKDGVRKTNQFKYWLSDNNKVYTGAISGSFSSKTIITAVYEFEDNKEAEPNNGIKLAQNSRPSAKDFIKNAYDDGDPNKEGNLPPGTKFDFVSGKEPDTSEIGTGKITTIKVTYPNGEVKEVDVSYDVICDVVEQTNPIEKPDVPDSFVKVVIKADNKFYVNGNKLKDEEVNELGFENLGEVERTFWVDPTKEVTIKVRKADKLKDQQNRTWSFNHWQVLDKYGNGRIYKTLKEITDKFTDIDGTYIHAIYSRDDVEVPDEKDLLITELGVQPTAEQYKANLTAPDGKTIDKVEILEQADVSRTGMTRAKLKVTYDDKTEAEFIVKVFVKDRYDPRPSEPQIIYRDRIVEKEKIVEKIVKIKDNERLKELRYMQGFNGKFRPYDGLRRCEAAQILANALKADGYAYDPFYPISYTDIGDSWYTEAVRIVSQAGVFQGYNDGTFKPEGKITRAEWVATLRRFQDLKKVSGNDMGLSMGHWATEEIEAAYQAGWLGVYQDGTAYFDADKPITRQEVAYVSNKAFDRVLDKAYLKRNVNNMIHYKDINPSMPLYEDILCASNTLLTDGRYYKANAIDMDALTFNIITDDLLIYQKKFQFFTER